MSKEYTFFYIESMVVCIIVFGILLVHDLIAGDRQERKFRFDNVLLAHIMYFTVDIFWAALKGGLIPKTQFTVLLINYLLLVLIALIGNTWFTFVAAMTHMPRRGTARGKFLITLPMLISSVVVLLLMIIRPSLWINENLEPTALYEIVFLLAPVIYIISAFLYSMYEAFKKENILSRKLYIILGIYPLTVLLSGIVQTFIPNVPIYCYNSMIMILLFNLLSMEAQISVDPLTGLNNRGQIMRYALQDSSIHKEGIRTYVLIADANDFKKINDTYGHVEGDRALVIIADVLREVSQRMEIPPFIGRYGGDEFVVIAYFYPQKDTQAEVNTFKQIINQNLRMTCKDRKLPYTLSLSIGAEELTQKDTFQTCLERADQKLYLEKRNGNIGR